MADNRAFYNEILIDHNMHPGHKHDLPDADVEMRGYNPSCGDDITMKLKLADGVVVDGAFQGSGCAISQASADMMLDLVIGKSEEEALRLADIFLRMIKGTASEEEIDDWRKQVCCRMYPTCRRALNAPYLAGIHWSRCWIKRPKLI